MSDDLDDAAVSRNAGEIRLKKAEEKIAEEEKTLKDLEADRQKALEEAKKDPTTENIHKAADAAKAVEEQTVQVRKSVEARNQALTKLNDLKLAEVKAMAAKGNEKLLASKGNPNGIVLKTDLNFEQFTGRNLLHILVNNLVVRVTGVERSTVLGGSLSIIGGMKNEFVFALKNGLLVPFEGKFVNGPSRNTFRGLKMDTIAGRKSDKTCRDKNEFHIGPRVEVGPTKKSTQPALDLLTGLGRAVMNTLRNIGKRGTFTTGKRNYRGSKVLNEVKNLKAAITKHKVDAQLLTSYMDEWKIETAKFEVESSDIFRYRGKSSASLSGGGATCKLGGGSAELKQGGTVTCNGGVSINGKTFIN